MIDHTPKQKYPEMKSWKGNKVLGAQSPVPWLIPLALVLITVFLYPVVEVIRLSFTNSNLIDTHFSYTLDSYVALFTNSGFSHMVGITFLFVIFSVVFQIALGFIIALLVDQGTKRKLFGTVIIRTTVLSAWAIPGVIIGIIWSMLYNESDAGILNYMLQSIGLSKVPFLSDPDVALASVIVANVWRGTAFCMILIYAGLQTLPGDVIEAAKIDGASSFQRIIKVVIPIISPILFINVILSVVATFNTFDMIMALTAGGPGRSTEVLALGVHSNIFQLFDLGQGAATAVVLFVINIVMTFIYFKFLEKN